LWALLICILLYCRVFKRACFKKLLGFWKGKIFETKMWFLIYCKTSNFNVVCLIANSGNFSRD
jgi:hypothetical protein